MVALPGNVDFMGQSAQTLRFVGALAVDTVGSQNIDISALLAPNDQALLFYWVANLGFTGLPCGVLVQTNSPTIFFTGHTQLADGAQATLPFSGTLAVGDLNAGATVIVDNIGPGAIHIQGTLYTFAFTAPPIVLPVIRRPFIGAGAVVNHTVTTATTQTVLAAPSAGTYYRLKSLNWSLNVAPAAATKVIWQALSTGLPIASTTAVVAASDWRQITLDLEWDDGVTVNNQTSVNVPCEIAYEVWPA